jgi:hypothetical protein
VTPALIAIIHLGVIVLAAWVTRRLLGAGAALLELFAAQARASARLAETADRLAAALERAPAPESESESESSPRVPPAPLAPPIAADPRELALAEIRAAIREAEWSRAEGLIHAFDGEHPDARMSARLQDELASARQSTAAALRTKLDAAREANDTDRVFELHQALAPLLAPDDLRELDRELARGFMGVLQKRLRNGVISIDVAMLASRVAEAFDTTPEGASLRAALPTLRRSVGLCARCGNPYTGIADACPACLAPGSLPVGSLAPVEPVEDRGDHAELSDPIDGEEINFEPD